MRLFSIILIIIGFSLASCGFKPLYGTHGAATTGQRMAAIELQTEQSRLGQHLYRNLAERFDYSRTPNYRLVVDLESSENEVAIGRDSRARRFDVAVVATYGLVSIASGQNVYKNRLVSRSSYNVIDSDFATEIARRDAERRAVDMLSDEIATHVALLLNRQAEAGQ